MLCAGSIALAALPAGAQSPEAGGCIGKARMRGPLWDSSTGALEPGLDVVLDDVARTIREQCDDKKIVIEGHAFEMPTAELNLKLAELRVALVRYELEQRGVAAWRLLPVALGDTQPLVPKKGREGALENRRITFRPVE